MTFFRIVSRRQKNFNKSIVDLILSSACRILRIILRFSIELSVAHPMKPIENSIFPPFAFTLIQLYFSFDSLAHFYFCVEHKWNKINADSFCRLVSLCVRNVKHWRVESTHTLRRAHAHFGQLSRGIVNLFERIRSRIEPEAQIGAFRRPFTSLETVHRRGNSTSRREARQIANLHRNLVRGPHCRFI